jgi:OHCU decarboxylase
MLTPSREDLLRCCGSTRWANEMTARRPFQDLEAMIAAADEIWGMLDPADWLEAFKAHPRIGERTADQQAAREQSRVAGAGSVVQERLAQGNREYETRFGYIFIISAQGKSAEEMLDALERRLGNPAGDELKVAAAEQAKITRLRLGRLHT